MENVPWWDSKFDQKTTQIEIAPHALMNLHTEKIYIKRMYTQISYIYICVCVFCAHATCILLICHDTSIQPQDCNIYIYIFLKHPKTSTSHFTHDLILSQNLLMLTARFIPKCYMEKESDHLDDFAPELAMVTKFGNEEFLLPHIKTELGLVLKNVLFFLCLFF